MLIVCSSVITIAAGRKWHASQIPYLGPSQVKAAPYSQPSEASSPSHKLPEARSSSSETSEALPISPGLSEPPVAESPAIPPEEVHQKNAIEVLLSFDDGPHVEPLGNGRNHTEKVLKVLRGNILQKDTKAVFFVQTHAPGRGGTPVGQEIIAMLAGEGHAVGIHTGSTADHANHCARASTQPYDADGNLILNRADGANGLESDMIRAKARIRELTGSDPLYVRPTYGERNHTVKAVYRRQELQMILWDIDSGDNTGSPSVDEVNLNIDDGMRRCISAGKRQLVILFHDINSRTAENLEEYLGNICISAKKLGKTVVFPTSAEKILQILNAKTYQ